MVHNPDAHIFVTRIFNQCFNQFINTNLDKKYIGKDIGHTQDIGIYKYGRYYYQARDLNDLRDRLLNQKVINNSVLKDAIRTVAEIYVATNNNEFFKKDIHRFIHLIREDHDLDLKSVFDAALKASKEKPKSTPKPTPKPEPKPIPTTKPLVEVIVDEPEEDQEPDQPEPPVKQSPREPPEEPQEPEEQPRARVCPECKNSEDVTEIHLRKGKDESYSCFKCKKCRITFDKKGKVLYRDEVPKEPKKKKSKWLMWIGVVLICLLLVVGVIAFLVLSKTKSEVIDAKNKTRTVYENVTLSSKISFQEYLDNLADYDQQEITTKCFLRRYVEGTGSSGKYIQALEDDSGKRFILTNAQSQYQDLFPKNGISIIVYEVTGILKKRYNGINIQVSSIKASQRDPAGTKQVEKIQTYSEESKREVVSPKFPLVRAFVLTLLGQSVACEDGTLVSKCSSKKPLYCGYSGLQESPVDCGCPEGQRLYKKECIPVVKCSDNTLAPECSVSKPKQCVDGNLVNNADLCGCPDDYRKSGKNCNKIMRCSDGTEYEKCASNKPYFCRDGALIKNAEECGCGWGSSKYGDDCFDSSKVESMEATDYLNTLRAENGRSPVAWNENLYNLALFRAKDMYDRKYFDHVTPDGKCVKDYKDNYGLGAYNIAENAGAVMYDTTSEGVNYASSANVKSQIDGWMESRGHRYNLLYPSHTLGVATCYAGACIFLGANQEYYGLGFGPCTTGDEGMAFWNGIGKQPGEV